MMTSSVYSRVLNPLWILLRSPQTPLEPFAVTTECSIFFWWRFSCGVRFFFFLKQTFLFADNDHRSRSWNRIIYWTTKRFFFAFAGNEHESIFVVSNFLAELLNPFAVTTECSIFLNTLIDRQPKITCQPIFLNFVHSSEIRTKGSFHFPNNHPIFLHRKYEINKSALKITFW
jgi:hypothetical protein